MSPAVARPLAEVVAKLGEAARDAGAERDHATAGAVVAVRAIVGALQESLGGQAIRGMAVLAWPDFRGASVVGPDAPHAQDTRLPRGGAEAMVLTPSARLVWAWQRPDGGVDTRPVLDRELRARDAEWLALAVRRAADRHCPRCAEVGRTWSGVAALAERLRRAAEG